MPQYVVYRGHVITPSGAVVTLRLGGDPEHRDELQKILEHCPVRYYKNGPYADVNWVTRLQRARSTAAGKRSGRHCTARGTFRCYYCHNKHAIRGAGKTRAAAKAAACDKHQSIDCRCGCLWLARYNTGTSSRTGETLFSWGRYYQGNLPDVTPLPRIAEGRVARAVFASQVRAPDQLHLF